MDVIKTYWVYECGNCYCNYLCPDIILHSAGTPLADVPLPFISEAFIFLFWCSKEENIHEYMLFSFAYKTVLCSFAYKFIKEFALKTKIFSTRKNWKSFFFSSSHHHSELLFFSAYLPILFAPISNECMLWNSLQCLWVSHIDFS